MFKERKFLFKIQDCTMMSNLFIYSILKAQLDPVSGYKYAMMSLKTNLANVIKHFHLTTDVKMADIKLDRLPSLSPDQANIKLTARTRADVK